MKTLRFVLTTVFSALAVFLSPALALTVQEGFQITDFPNSAGAADTYILDLGGNDFVGASSGSDSDYFKVTVLPGRKVTVIQTTGSAGHAMSLPLYAGTYQFVVGNVLPGNEAWGFTFVVAAAEDYSVSTTGGQIVVTDRSGFGDTLTVSEAFPDTIRFAAPGRTFSLNGAAFITGNSGSISHTFSTDIIVNAGAGSDTIAVGAFSSDLPNLTINGGAGDDTVNFTGGVTFVPTGTLAVAEFDGTRYTTETVNVLAGAVVRVPGASLTIHCARNVAIEPGGSLESPTSANVTVTANEPGIPTTGDFIGVRVNGGKISSANGQVSVEGRGGNAPGGSQLGVEVTNGGKIMATDTGGRVIVKGTGGDNTGLVNRGVTVSGAGSEIRTIGGDLIVQGFGGPNGAYYGIGVSVLSGGVIRSTQVGLVQVYGTGAGAGGFNMGIELGGGTISTGTQTLEIFGQAGVGSDSRGVFVNNGSTVATINAGSILVRADSLSIDATSSISSAPSYSVTLGHRDILKSIDLGGADPADKLSLSDAVLDRIFTSNLVIGDIFAAAIFTSAEVSPANATDVTLSAAPVQPLFSGTDVTLNGTGTLTVAGPLVIPITGASANTAPGYPQLKVVGQVDLSTTPLDLTGTTFPGVAGNVFTIVDNDGSDAIIDTFAGLPEGTIFAWPGSPLLKARISYVGGSGNDVVLSLVSALEVTHTDSFGPGSLGDVLAYAASLPGANTITFHPSLSGAFFGAVPYAVNDAGGVTLDASALPGGVTFDGSQDSQLFTNASGSSLTLRRLILTKGRSGGGGGAISNDGTLTLEQCTLRDNRAVTGGAIFNQGTLTLTGCTLRNNVTTLGGGAIDNLGTLTLTRCTLASNSAAGGSGGAIFHDEEAGTLTLTHCTLAANVCQSANGGAISADGPLALHYCLVAGNSGNAVYTSDTFTDTQSQITSSAALLAPLGDYGGPTQTIALLPGHAAREAATTSTSTSDQRGNPIVGTPDVGAYETGIPRNYAAWHYETLPATATPAQRAPGFDYDGDGRLNVLEYATFTDGAAPGGSTGTTFLRLPDGTEARFTFTVNAFATDLLYELQRSLPGVGPWVTIGDVNLRTSLIHNYGVGVTNIPSLFSIEFRDPGIAGQGKAFYRLQVSVP